MPRYKVGERIVVGLVEAIVVRGNCESCFFYNHKEEDYMLDEEGCMLDEEVCIDEIGFDNCYKVLEKGL